MNRFANLRPRTWLMLTLFAVLVGLVLAQAPGVSAAVKQISRLAIPTIPATINYQGILRNTDGTLTNGTFNITANVYDASTAGNLLYSETFNNVNVRDGIFNIVLGDGTPLGTAFEGAPRYIGISLNGGAELTPRERVHGVPWAIYATNALNATNATNADFATQAGNATTANSATAATSADWLSDIGCCDLYTAGDINSASSDSQSLNFLDTTTGFCFLSKVQSAAVQASSCEVDLPNATLRAGPFSYCEAQCVDFGN